MSAGVEAAAGLAVEATAIVFEAATTVGSSARALKACGAMVTIEPEDFAVLVKGLPDPLVVHAVGGFFKINYRYLTSYKGIAFFTKSPEPLDFHSGVELIRACSISIPG